MFDISGVMLPLQLPDIYFLSRILIWGIQEETHPSMGAQAALEVFAALNYGGSLDAISDGLLQIVRIADVMTRFFDMLVV